VDPTVLLIDPIDRDLERSLASQGLRVTLHSGAELANLVHPAARVPDVVVVDTRGGRPLPPALQSVRRQHPALGAVVIASQQDPALMLEAMRAGATEFLAEPLKSGDIEAAIGRVVAQRAAPTMGEVFACIGAKGGVGTTTTAVNVATSLAQNTKAKTLVIDLHLAHGDAALLLGAEPRFSIVDALENTHRFDAAFFRGLVAPSKAGPDVLASSDRTLIHSAGTPEVRAVIEFAAQNYQYVVLDVSRSDAAALEALDAASRILVIANQELSTVRSASRIASALRHRYGATRVEIVLNRFDRQADIAQRDVEKAVGLPVRHTLPSDYRVALEALNRGRPVALENHSRLSAAYKTLASALAGVEPEGIDKPQSKGTIFGLFRQ